MNSPSKCSLSTATLASFLFYFIIPKKGFVSKAFSVMQKGMGSWAVIWGWRWALPSSQEPTDQIPNAPMHFPPDKNSWNLFFFPKKILQTYYILFLNRRVESGLRGHLARHLSPCRNFLCHQALPVGDHLPCSWGLQWWELATSRAQSRPFIY